MSVVIKDLKRYQGFSLEEKYELLNKKFNSLCEQPTSSLLVNQLQMLSEQMKRLAEQMRENGSIDALRYTQANSQVESALAEKSAQFAWDFRRIAGFAQSQLLFSYFSFHDLARTAEVCRGWNRASRNSWNSLEKLPAIPEQEVEKVVAEAKAYYAAGRDVLSEEKTSQRLEKFVATLAASNQWTDAAQIYRAMWDPGDAVHDYNSWAKCDIVKELVILLIDNQQMRTALILAEQFKQHPEDPDKAYAETIFKVAQHLAQIGHAHLAIQITDAKLQEPWRSKGIAIIMEFLFQKKPIAEVIALSKLIPDEHHSVWSDRLIRYLTRHEKQCKEAFEKVFSWPETPMRNAILNNIFRAIVYNRRTKGDSTQLDTALHMLERFPSMPQDAIDKLATHFAQAGNPERLLQYMR